MNKIVKLRDMGFLIAEITEILEHSFDDKSLLCRLENKKREVQNAIACENEKLLRLERMIISIGMEDNTMIYEVTIKDVPAYKVVSLREIIPAYNMEGLLWNKLGEFIEREKIQCTAPSFAIYHDQEYKEADVGDLKAA